MLACLCYNKKTNVGALRIKRRLKLTTLLFSFRGLRSVCGTILIYGKWDDTYELGEYCFSLLRDHVSTELFSNYQEIEELAIQVDSSYEEGHFKLDIHLPKDLNSDNEQEILSF